MHSGERMTLCVGSLLSASCECLRVALMSCATLPPKAMANVCMPLQMPNMGICRLKARRVMSSSGKSRVALMPCSSFWGSSPAHKGL